MGIEHAIVTKDAEVTDAPSRFLALLYFFRPSLIVSLNSLVYGLEGESPPDTAPSKAAEVEVKRKQKKAVVPGGSFSVLKALGSVLAFFSWRCSACASEWHGSCVTQSSSWSFFWFSWCSQ